MHPFLGDMCDFVTHINKLAAIMTHKRKHILSTIVFLAHLAIFSQCIEKDKIRFGVDDFSDFQSFYPTYRFSYVGVKSSTNGKLLYGATDIKKAPKEVLIFKDKIENEIKNYSGNDLYSKLVFESVRVLNEEKLKTFTEKEKQNFIKKCSKVKYCYYYELKLDTVSTYIIVVALDKNGKRISKYHFPNKSNYAPINADYDYCKLIEIAKKSQPLIEPVESIKLDYDDKSQRFYWQLNQEIVNPKEGENYSNQVIIDASDMTKIKISRKKTYIKIK
jgi:hypothetical protein